MPRKAKEETNKIGKVKPKKETNTKKTTTKKVTSKKTPTNSKEKSSNKKTKTIDKKTSVAKKTSAKKVATKKQDTKKTTKKKVTSKKETTKRKKVEIVEYYDLPYRYSQTVVKILAQSPNTLFVYWDISDEDRNKYIEQYGEYFFNNTKPVLIIHNKTKNEDFEVDINDFANSWYLRLIDSNCNYEIELGRIPINNYVSIENNYMKITTSNNIISPNDHILFEKLSHFVYFKNVKTNELVKKDINLTLLSKIGKTSSIIELYKKLYKDDKIDFNRLDLQNPSSNNPTSSFK